MSLDDQHPTEYFGPDAIQVTINGVQRSLRHVPRGAGKTAQGKEWAARMQQLQDTPPTVTVALKDVSPEFLALATGVRLLDIMDTPQNRDAWRRAKLEHGPSTPIDDSLIYRSGWSTPSSETIEEWERNLENLPADDDDDDDSPELWGGPIEPIRVERGGIKYPTPVITIDQINEQELQQQYGGLFKDPGTIPGPPPAAPTEVARSPYGDITITHTNTPTAKDPK